MNADGTNPITSPATPRRRADDLESLAIATVDLIRAGDLTLDVSTGGSCRRLPGSGQACRFRSGDIGEHGAPDVGCQTTVRAQARRWRTRGNPPSSLLNQLGSTGTVTADAAGRTHS